MNTDPLHRTIGPLAVAGPAAVTCWTGAGVSMDGPSCLPSAWRLTEHVFSLFFAPDSFATVMKHHAAIEWSTLPLCGIPTANGAANAPSTRLPRLETVLGVADRALDDHRAFRILDDLRTVPSNRVHQFFAEHLHLGGSHITANFDDCIERAYQHAYGTAPDPERVFHFHGSVQDDPNHGTLGATLSRIEKGFEEKTAEQLRQGLTRTPFLIVAGYSGGDFFDVDVTLNQLAASALTGLQVVWLNHASHPDWHVVTGELPGMVRLLEQAGATVTVLCGVTADFFNTLATAWGSTPLAPVSPGTAWNPQVMATEAEKAAATLLLYRELGLMKGIEAVLADDTMAPHCPPADLRWARSELLWEQGRYRDLRRLWAHDAAPEGVTPAQRVERIGATLWVQGRLIPAYAWLRWHRERSHLKDDPALLETEGRVIEHMGRVPGMRTLAKALIPSYAHLLVELRNTSKGTESKKLDDVHTSLESLLTGTSRSEQHSTSSRSWFSETGSLLGYLNFHHRQLRDSYDESTKPAQLRRAYTKSQAFYESIGSVAGKARAHLLPGAEKVFTLQEYAQGLFAVQYGWIHRARLGARFAALRTRFRLTEGATHLRRLRLHYQAIRLQRSIAALTASLGESEAELKAARTALRETFINVR
ncbi:SIR2 family protein [Streptomyces sp. NPDC059980]|uniref:SIR2 family protein n=1 Tax=Streptomyces sp. NPDC059980 TaxID=3347022 RepID=UPI0036747FCF